VKIGIIGSGMIGSTAARLFVAAGHEVAIANSRGPDSLVQLAQEVGPRLRPMSVSDATMFGDLVLVAVPFGVIQALPAEPFAGKIVIDANNYYTKRDGHNDDLDNDRTTSTELLAAHLPEARVVKALNTMHFKALAAGGDEEKALDDRLALFVAGDDPEAKATVGTLIEDLGFAAIDTGGLAAGGRRQQPGSPIYAADMTAAQAHQALEA
jgi:8-hydroxy-5-deazaflavin:NADPH oxidoreductase